MAPFLRQYKRNTQTSAKVMAGSVGREWRSAAPARPSGPSAHLHSLAEVLSLAFLGDDRLVDLASGDVVVARQIGVDESLVIA